MKRTLSNVGYLLKDAWLPLLTVAVIVALGVVIAMTNHCNPVSIWLKELYFGTP